MRPRTDVYRRARLCLLLAMLTGCPRTGPDDNTLLLLTDAVLPAADPAETVQATQDSADGRARITVFPGTTIPADGLSIEVIDPDELPARLRSVDVDAAVRLGPDGTEFDPPVRVSTLLGEAVVNDDGSIAVPEVEVLVSENGEAVPVADFEVEVTADRLLIVHAILSHFSDLMYKVGIGILIGVDSPAEDSVHLVGEPFATGLRATNNSERAARLKARETPQGQVGPITFDESILALAAAQSNFLGIGSCACMGAGDGIIQYDVIGDNKETGAINPSFVRFRKFVDVICAELETEIAVSFDAEAHTTHYSVRVFHKTFSNNYQREEITFGGSVAYRWTSAAACGTFGNPGDDPRNSFEHEGCDAASEAASRVQVEVTYTAEDGSKFTRVYDAAGRANEGMTVTF